MPLLEGIENSQGLTSRTNAMCCCTNTKQLPSDEHDVALPYAEERRRYGCRRRAKTDGRGQALCGLSERSSCRGPGRVAAGAAFSVEVEILYWRLQL